MKPHHAVALALVALIFCAGCEAVSVYYYPDPSLHVAGWKCPDPDKMSHLVTFADPACAWVPGEIFTKSCEDKRVAAAEQARGCVPDASPTAASTPAVSAHN
jgi:hypothetical protein